MKKLGLIMVGLMVMSSMAFGEVEINGWGKIELMKIQADTENATADGLISIAEGFGYDSQLRMQVGDVLLEAEDYGKGEGGDGLGLFFNVSNEIGENTTVNGKFNLIQDGDFEFDFADGNLQTKIAGLDIGVYPYAANTNIGDAFPSAGWQHPLTQEAPGVTIAKNMGSLDVSGVVNFDTTKGNEDKDADNLNLGYKAAATFTGVPRLTLTGEFAGNTTEPTYDMGDWTLYGYDMALNGRGAFDMGPLDFSGELLMAMYNDENGDATRKGSTTTAMTGGASLDMGGVLSIAKKTVVAGKVYIIGENMMYDIGDWGYVKDPGQQVLVGEANMTFPTGLTLDNKLEIFNANEDVYADADGKATGTKMAISSTLTYWPAW